MRKLKPSLLLGAAFALLALVTLMGTTDTVRAQTFNPEGSIEIVNPEPEVSSDFLGGFNLAAGDVNFAGLVAFIPGDWGIVPGDQIPIGAVVGTLSSEVTLGLINSACDSPLFVEFTFLNASIDPSDTVSFLDSDDNGDEDFIEDKDNSGLPDAFEKYTEFITRVLDDIPGDEVGQPLQPIRRSTGISIVAGVNILLQLLTFAPGTFINENIPNDEALGYPTVVLLQNFGDPEQDPVPGPITDFCTPLTSSNTTLGVSKDNECTDDIPPETLDPLCAVIGAISLEEGATTPDESGLPLYVNPQDGTYNFTSISAGLRDADGDGYENLLDTCPFDANEGDPRIKGDGDFDEDGLDAACDPDDNRTNSDEDLDGFLNRQDNCPLVANGELEDSNRDSDNDQIGDACDPDPDDADAQGELMIITSVSDVKIGTGEGEGGPPSADACPNCFGVGGDGGAAGDSDDDGNTLIIIIIVVIAVVVVGGGGAFLYMRRGSGGGGATA